MTCGVYGSPPFTTARNGRSPRAARGLLSPMKTHGRNGSNGTSARNAAGATKNPAATNAAYLRRPRHDTRTNTSARRRRGGARDHPVVVRLGAAAVARTARRSHRHAPDGTRQMERRSRIDHRRASGAAAVATTTGNQRHVRRPPAAVERRPRDDGMQRVAAAVHRAVRHRRSDPDDVRLSAAHTAQCRARAQCESRAPRVRGEIRAGHPRRPPTPRGGRATNRTKPRAD